LETFVDEAYSIERYKLAYNTLIHPVQDPTFWPNRNLPRIGPPPTDDIGRGRPEIARRKDIIEVRGFQRASTIRCSQCGVFGHNKRSHTGQSGSLVNTPEKRQRNKKRKRPITRPPKQGSSKSTMKLKTPQAE